MEKESENILIHPTYFGPISIYKEAIKADVIHLEICDHFQKQTYRNRCYISSPNGRLMLNVPVRHLKATSRKKTIDTLIDYDTEDWRKKHLKSLQNTYQSSPYFEFYEDEIQNIFQKKHKYLIDLNIEAHTFICEALGIDSNFKKTVSYEKNINALKDYRIFVDCKQKINQNFDEYRQMFIEKNRFLENLSILDLIFMQGPASEIYLKK